MEYKIGETIEHGDLSYTVVKAVPGVDQCSQCDLCIGRRKLCFRNSFDVGDCGYAYNRRRDGNNVVFKLLDYSKASPDEIKAVKEEQKLIMLLHDNEALKEENCRLREVNRELTEKNSAYKSQLKSIYANINVAIKREIYKNMNKR